MTWEEMKAEIKKGDAKISERETITQSFQVAAMNFASTVAYAGKFPKMVQPRELHEAYMLVATGIGDFTKWHAEEFAK